MTPLQYAARYGNSEITSLLIKKGADVNAADASGATPLHWAVVKRKTEAVQMLIEAGANVNLRVTDNPDEYSKGMLKSNLIGKTPLEMALTLGDEATANLLREHGAR